MPLVGSAAPHFKAMAVTRDNTAKCVSLGDRDYRGKYVLLFFFAIDNSSSEIIAFNKAIDQFRARKVEVIGCSVDSHYTHVAWRSTTVKSGGIGPIKFPLMSDLSTNIAKDYDVLGHDGVALNGLFLIDQQQVVRHAVINVLPLGRSVDEALRMVDALQFTETHGEVCPANWKKGDRGMKPTSAGVAEYLAAMELAGTD